MSKQSFQLIASECKKLLKPLFSAINHSSVLPILEDVLIEKKDERLIFTTTDLENVVSVEIPTTKGPDFSLCLYSTRLTGIFNNAIDNTISFEYFKNKLKIQNGDFNMTVSVDDYLQYPKNPVVENYVSVTIDAKEINQRMQNVIKFVSNDDLRPSMTGVFLTDRKGELHLVATDAHRLYYTPIMKTPSALKGIAAIIPKKGARLLIQMFTSGPVVMKISKTHLHCSGDQYSLISRLIDARYPDFETVIPKLDLNFSMQRKQLAAFLKIAAPFVNGVTRQIIFKIDELGIAIDGGDFDTESEFSYKMPIYAVQQKFAPFYFGVNLKFLQEAISVTKDEYVKMAHSGIPTKAMILDDCCLLMPLMINGYEGKK